MVIDKSIQKNTIKFIILLFSFTACQSKNKIYNTDNGLYTKLVNPFIGTGGHGHTYPGATLPFGMMQLSPDTRLDGWDGCSGYHYSDSIVYGFSHTHLSGTGVSDYGDILIMPTNEIIFNNGSDGKKGYRSTFSHQTEVAQPGYYKVDLANTNTQAELTVSKRSGMHRYTYAQDSAQVLMIDLIHRDEVLDSELEVVSNTEIQGYRHSKAWAEKQYLFYYIKFSKPFQKVEYANGDTSGKKVVAGFSFNPKEGQTLEVKIGISAVNKKGAKLNMESEIAQLTFNDIRQKADSIWNKQLQKISVQSSEKEDLFNFYTSMYHSMIAPNLYQDIDGRYRGMDLDIHQSQKHKHYTVFSLWDTYRATHPLYTLIEQERTQDFVKTFIHKYKNGGIMPIWDLSANYTGCMIGYHAVPVIADAYLKGIDSYSVEEAYAAMKHSAMQDKLGLQYYKETGFIPLEKESESVSKTLEYAYDDWTIAQMAKALNKQEDYAYFLKRSQNYKNILDPESKFMRAKYKNGWFSPFDPYEVNFNYTEANAWQYSFYVPQDVETFIQYLGGKNILESHLDSLFSAKAQTSGRNQADITGLIGQYAHGNEPSHHIAYLYNYINKPHKTQKYIRQILDDQYQNQPDGISGNEDCGQMSAWYIFSALGFYPVCPGSNEYIIGSPLLDDAKIKLENGNVFHIKTIRKSKKDIYIESVKLNGEDYPYSYLKHQTIINGGELEFTMSHKPSTWGTKDKFLPKSRITEHQIVAVPFIQKGKTAFYNSTTVFLGNIDPNAQIFYKKNSLAYKPYTTPIQIDTNDILTMYAEKEGIKSKEVKTSFHKLDPDVSIQLESSFANQYNAGGNNALIDGIFGTTDFRTGTWQGYQNEDLNFTINLGGNKNVKTIEIGFLKDQKSWIFLPKEIQLFTSEDGQNFKFHETQTLPSPNPNDKVEIKRIKWDNIPKNTSHIKIHASNLKALPEWHLGYSFQGKPWLFADEVSWK